MLTSRAQPSSLALALLVDLLSQVKMKLVICYFNKSCELDYKELLIVVIQGDVKEDLFDVIPEKWPEIEESDIDDLGN